jgi:hypothetical protein
LDLSLACHVRHVVAKASVAMWSAITMIEFTVVTPCPATQLIARVAAIAKLQLSALGRIPFMSFAAE